MYFGSKTPWRQNNGGSKYNPIKNEIQEQVCGHIFAFLKKNILCAPQQKRLLCIIIIDSYCFACVFLKIVFSEPTAVYPLHNDIVRPAHEYSLYVSQYILLNGSVGPR